MIPQFPNFKNLEWTDRREIESVTRFFPPYSDFNFITMWAWNTNESVKVSSLNDNLIFSFFDIITEENYFSFIGLKKLVETATALTRFSWNNNIKGILKYIPEEVAKCISCPDLKVVPEEQDFDYIISVDELANINDSPGKLGQRCRQFTRTYSDSNIHVDIKPINEIDMETIHDLFIKWADKKNIDHLSLEEYRAFERYFSINDKNIFVLTIQDDKMIIGFVTLEILSDEYSILNFGKADINYKGIYQFMDWKMGEFLKNKNIKYLNIEEDLGIEALRNMKMQLNPKFFLRNYKIETQNRNNTFETTYSSLSKVTSH
jgi:hypothetical protein